MVSKQSLLPAIENAKLFPSIINYQFYFRIARRYLEEEQNTRGLSRERVQQLDDYFALQLDNLQKYGDKLVCQMCQRHPTYNRQGTDTYVNCKIMVQWPCAAIKRRGCPWLHIDLKEQQLGIMVLNEIGDEAE